MLFNQSSLKCFTLIFSQDMLKNNSLFTTPIDNFYTQDPHKTIQYPTIDPKNFNTKNFDKNLNDNRKAENDKILNKPKIDYPSKRQENASNQYYSNISKDSAYSTSDEKLSKPAFFPNSFIQRGNPGDFSNSFKQYENYYYLKQNKLNSVSKAIADTEYSRNVNDCDNSFTKNFLNLNEAHNFFSPKSFDFPFEKSSYESAGVCFSDKSTADEISFCLASKNLNVNSNHDCNINNFYQNQKSNINNDFSILYQTKNCKINTRNLYLENSYNQNLNNNNLNVINISKLDLKSDESVNKLNLSNKSDSEKKNDEKININLINNFFITRGNNQNHLSNKNNIVSSDYNKINNNTIDCNKKRINNNDYYYKNADSSSLNNLHENLKNISQANSLSDLRKNSIGFIDNSIINVNTFENKTLSERKVSEFSDEILLNTVNSLSFDRCENTTFDKDINEEKKIAKDKNSEKIKITKIFEINWKKCIDIFKKFSFNSYKGMLSHPIETRKNDLNEKKSNKEILKKNKKNKNKKIVFDSPKNNFKNEEMEIVKNLNVGITKNSSSYSILNTGSSCDLKNNDIEINNNPKYLADLKSESPYSVNFSEGKTKNNHAFSGNLSDDTYHSLSELNYEKPLIDDNNNNEKNTNLNNNNDILSSDLENIENEKTNYNKNNKDKDMNIAVKANQINDNSVKTSNCNKIKKKTKSKKMKKNETKNYYSNMNLNPNYNFDFHNQREENSFFELNRIKMNFNNNMYRNFGMDNFDSPNNQFLSPYDRNFIYNVPDSFLQFNNYNNSNFGNRQYFYTDKDRKHFNI